MTPYVGLEVVWRWPNGTNQTVGLFNVSDAYPWVDPVADPNWQLREAVASYDDHLAQFLGFAPEAPYIE